MLDGEDVVGAEVLAGQRGEGALGVECVGRQDPAREREPLVQFQQHRPDFRDLVGLGGNLPVGEHDCARGGRQQEQAGPVRADGAADFLAVAGQVRLQDRAGQRVRGRLRDLRRREIAGHGISQGLRADQAEQPGDRLPARCLPPAVRAGARADGGQQVLAGVRDPRRDAGQRRPAAQHGHQHQRQDGRQGVPPAAPGARVRDRREAVRHAPAGRRLQLRGPLRQRRPGPVRLRAQPLFCRPLPFPLPGGVPAAFLLTAPGRFRFPCRPPGPRLLPHRGQADDLLRLRDRGLGGIRQDGHAKLVRQRGLPGGERMSDTPCPSRVPVALPAT